MRTWQKVKNTVRKKKKFLTSSTGVSRDTQYVAEAMHRWMEEAYDYPETTGHFPLLAVNLSDRGKSRRVHRNDSV